MYCDSEKSCENTTITLAEGAWLNVYCNENSSCVNAKITELRALTAYGQNTLTGAHINCHSSGCNVNCMDTLSCSNSEIDGTNSGILEIECKKYQSCLDMTIRCPPGAMNREFCIITGSKGNQAVVHNEFNIYAPNGWGDIRFVDYEAYILSGQLYCGGNASSLLSTQDEYSCDIQYGIWDCKDITSPCSNQTWLALDSETFICDGINGQNTCNDQEIICKEPTELTYLHTPACNLLCVGDNTCQNLVFQCDHEKTCDIVCAGEGSCNGLRVRVM